MSETQTRLLPFVSLLVILAYLSPLLLLGQNANVTIHDHLDGVFVMTKLLAESGKIIAPLGATIDNVINGAPRAVFLPELNLTVWLFYFLGPYGAYVVNQALIRFIAFCGMYLLLRYHFLKDGQDRIVALGGALTFALLPYYALFGLSIAGQPLVLHAFLTIRRNQADWKDWLIIAIVPLYSIFVISYAFFLCGMAGLWIYDWSRYRIANRSFAGAIALMSAVSVVVEYRLVMSLLAPSAGFISHRVEFAISSKFSAGNALRDATMNFLFGQGHAASLHHLVILPTVVFAACVILLRKIKVPLFFSVLGVIGLISHWYGFWFLLLEEAKGLLRGLPYVNLSRFYFLHPMLWYVLFALALHTLWRHVRFGPVLVAAALVTQMAFLFYRSDHFTQRRLGSPTYAEFFSTQLYREIDRFIGRKKETYRIVSIGMHPAIAQYNGFYTLDGYHYNYPLSYKHQFRQLIAGELEKSAYFRSYFDDWGSRFYVMVSELDGLEPATFMLTRKLVRSRNIHIQRLDFNTPLFKAMGGQYVFSAVSVENSAEIGLRLLKVFGRDDSPWEVYVYQAI